MDYIVFQTVSKCRVEYSENHSCSFQLKIFNLILCAVFLHKDQINRGMYNIFSSGQTELEKGFSDRELSGHDHYRATATDPGLHFHKENKVSP